MVAITSGKPAFVPVDIRIEDEAELYALIAYLEFGRDAIGGPVVEASGRMEFLLKCLRKYV